MFTTVQLQHQTDKHSGCRHLYQVTMEIIIGLFIQLEKMQLYYNSFFFNVQDGKKKTTFF